MMRPPDDHYPTPDEFDDSRFSDGYWASAVITLVILVSGGSYVLMAWCGWTGEQTKLVVGLGIVVWIAVAVVVYRVWSRVRRTRRQGGRR
jgi:hypothetical protein